MYYHVYKRKRKKNGKTVTAQTYTGRYKLEGDSSFTEIKLGVSEKQTAEKKLREIAIQAERERAGLVMPKTESDCLNASLADLIENYISELETLGRSFEYVRHVSARVLALGNECGWVRLRDINADSFRKWRKHKQASIKTLNEYLNSVNAFVNWIVKTKRIPFNPLESVQKIDARGRQSFERRALTVPEACSLLSCAPLDRRVGYALALFTGLRRGEIKALEWRDINLNAQRPFISVRASTTKNGRSASIPMHADLVNILKEWQKNCDDLNGLVLFCGIPKNRDGLLKDLEKANIERVDASGRKVDFHALRHTTCSFLQAVGVSARVAMEIMRHSDMRLTNKTYTDAGCLPTANAR